MSESTYSDREALRRLWPYFFISKLRLIGVAVLIVISIATGVILPLVISTYIDTVLIQKYENNYLLYIGIYLAVLLLSLAVQYLQIWFFAVIGENAIIELRQDVFEKLQYHSQDYFDYNSTGDTVSRVTNDVSAIQPILSGSVLFTISSIITIIGMVGVMVSKSIILTLVALIVIPMGLLANRLNEYAVRPVIKSSYKQLGKLSSIITENIHGAKVSAAFARVEYNNMEFDKENASMSHEIYLLFRNAGLVQPFFELFGTLMIIIVLGAGIFLRAAGNTTITIGILYLFISYTQNISTPVRTIAQLSNSIQNSFESYKRILTLLDEPISVKEVANAKQLKITKGEIKFDQVSFIYNQKGLQVFDDFSLEIAPHEVVAIVGKTGAGKSTLTKLLIRLYDVGSGMISIDGQDIRDVTIKSLRQSIGFVIQEPILFERSIRDNLTLNIDLDDDQIYELLDLVGASFVRELPQGLETQVGERGSRLSLGQRQLLCFARTLAIDPKILILDEATSSIDTQAELKIQQAMDKMFEARTSIIIAHRLSTVKKADRIIVMDQGRIVEEGTIDELLQRKGEFYQLYNLQYDTE